MNIVVNADDFGKSHEVNMGIVEGFKRGIITRTTIMVNMPFADEAVQLAVSNNFFDKVGLHLNLTEGKCLTKDVQNISWVCSGNRFNNKIRNYLRSHLFVRSKDIQLITAEIEAQIRLYITYGFPMFHIDSHHHVHNEYLVFSCIRKLTNKYPFKSIRIARNLMCTNGSCQKMKWIYKLFLNRFMKNHFETTDYFGSYQDYCEYGRDNKSSVEIMVHPIMVEGRLYDIVDGGKLLLMDNYNL